MRQKWKEKRKAKQHERDPLLVQEIRIQKKLNEVEPGSDAYKELQQELKMIAQIRAESKESKRRIAKSDKGGIIISVLKFLGIGAGVGTIVWAENKGMIFTGEKRKFMDSVSSSLGRLFFHG